MGDEKVDICGQLCSLAYKTRSTDEDIEKDLVTIKSSLKLFRYERAPIGCLAVLDTSGDELYVSYRGTDNNISQYLIDGSIGFLGDEPKRMDEFTSAMSSMHYFGEWAGTALNLLRNYGGEEAGEELLQTFSFRALMFAKRSVELSHPTKVIITGHSLGGMYAQIVGRALGFEALTFGAPGVGRFYHLATQDFEFYLNPTDKQTDGAVQTHISSQGDLIGDFGDHGGERIVVPYVPYKGIPDYLQKLKTRTLEAATATLAALRPQIQSKTINQEALQAATLVLEQSKSKQTTFSMLLSMVSSTKQQTEVDNIQKYLDIESFIEKFVPLPLELSHMDHCFTNHQGVISALKGIPSAATMRKEANNARILDCHSIRATLMSFHQLKGRITSAESSLGSILDRVRTDDTTSVETASS